MKKIVLSERLNHDNIFLKYPIAKSAIIWPIKDYNHEQLLGVAAKNLIKSKMAKKNNLYYGSTYEVKNLCIPELGTYKSYILIGKKSKAEIILPTMFMLHEDSVYLYVLGAIKSSDIKLEEKAQYGGKKKDWSYGINITKSNFDQNFCVRYVGA